jgi:hypothetical protein
MDIGEAEEYVHEWGISEQGRSDGITLAIWMAAKLLCREGTTEGQREVLVGLYDSLPEAKTNGG